MRHFTVLLTSAFLAAPTLGIAAGSDDSTPPKPTQTASDCKAGQVFDKQSKTCLDAKSEFLDDDTRYDAVRELAYAGAHDRALLVLAAMSDQSESRVLTYRGFLARQTGDMSGAFEFYAQALKADADNILARSYMGQGMVKLGQIEAAKMQLTEIRSRGGEGTWAEASLNKAITTGLVTNY